VYLQVRTGIRIKTNMQRGGAIGAGRPWRPFRRQLTGLGKV
jgi:hypothetical protein